MADKIKYLKHPVTPEEKAKWRGQGYKILDERFDPDYEKKRAEAAAKAAEERKKAEESERKAAEEKAKQEAEAKKKAEEEAAKNADKK